MSLKRKVWVVGLLALWLTACQRLPSLALNQPAPDWVLVDAQSQKVTLASRLGQPLLVEFWSSSCGVCVVEMQDLQALHDAYGDQVEVVFVNIDAQYPHDSRWRQNGRIRLPTLHDPLQITAERYLVMGTPTLVLIDAKGLVQQHHVGLTSRAQMQRWIAPYLKTQP